jgi:hypothetical protein
MLNGKLYAIFDPYLSQQVLRSKVASAYPFQREFAQKVFGLSDITYAKIMANPSLLPEFTEAMHQSFHKESLQKMNMRWLINFTRKIDPISGGNVKIDSSNLGRERVAADGVFEVANLYLWCRDIMTLATTKALYGDHDPFSQDKDLLDKIS